jgi:outer membrane protein assembly factor BamB
MRNKTITVSVLFSIILLGSIVAIWLLIPRSAKSPNDTLSLDEVWTFQANSYILATPILIDDQLIFRTADKIYSINAVTGNTNWETTARASDITINVNYIGQPIVGNSKFLISEEKYNSIGIYSTKTGEKLWTVEGQENIINAPIEIVDNIMIVARHDGNLVVYDLSAHKKLWSVALPPRTSTPIAANSGSVIVGMGDVLHVYGLKDGILLNEKTYAESLVAEIELSKSNIFISHAKEGGDWTISALQLDSLDTNWAFHAGKINHPDLSETNDHLSVVNQTLIVLDANQGDVLWEDNAKAFYSAPAFHENSLFFISRSRQGMFGKETKICKVETRKDARETCSVIDSSGYLLGPLATGDLLIVPRGSEIVAFTIP